MMLHAYKNAWAAFILISSLIILTIGWPAYAAPELTVVNYQLVSSKRINRTEFEYTYKADVKNLGNDALDVSANLNISLPGINVIDGHLTFGDVLSGAEITSSDTFTFRQDRSFAVSEADFIWTINSIQFIEHENIEASVLNGTLSTKNVSFVFDKAVENLSFDVVDNCENYGNCYPSPKLSSLIEIVQLTTSPVEDGSELELALILNVPADMVEGDYSGSLYFRDGDRIIARSIIHLTVTSGSAVTVPAGISTPSLDRIAQDTELDVKYVKDAAEIIVAENTDLYEIESLLLSIGGVFEGELGALGIYQIRFPGTHSSEALDDLIAQLRNSPFIEGASRVALIDSRQFIPPEYTSDWDEESPIVGHPAQALMYAKFLSAWGLAYEYVNPENATEINVGIIDQGFDKNHVDLLPNISKMSSIVPLSIGDHGTSVAGVVGAVANVATDGLKTVGALWNVDLILMDLGLYNIHLNVIDKISKSINAGAKVINYSGGKTYPDNSLWLKNSEANARAMYRKLFSSCFSIGSCASDVLFLFSVGNDNDKGTGISEDFVNDVPSSLSLEYSNVVSVGAVLMGPDSLRSGQGGNIDVAAPGSVWTTISGNKWGEVIGTSYAAPMVAGLAGLILTRNPDLAPDQIKNIIKTGSCINPDPNLGKVIGENYYVINAEESLKLADNPDAAINACKDKPAPTPTGKLNDTGITTCSDNSANRLPCPVDGFPGQDAEHGRDALAAAGLLQKVGGGSAGFDFTKLDANGNPLPASATEWSCVKDNHTGLIWEIKATSGLRSLNHSYTWYNPDHSTDGGGPGVQNGGNCSGSSCDTHGYVQAVNAQGLCGANDWRMPAREELRGIVDYSRIGPAIDTGYFPHTPSGWFWSASPYAGSVSGAWFVDFGDGDGSIGLKTLGRRVRLVRGGQ